MIDIHYNPIFCNWSSLSGDSHIRNLVSSYTEEEDFIQRALGCAQKLNRPESSFVPLLIIIKRRAHLTWDQSLLTRRLRMRTTSYTVIIFEARRIVGVFRPYSPVKMSDMEDDFMCDDEEDYDLVNEAADIALHAHCVHIIG